LQADLAQSSAKIRRTSPMTKKISGNSHNAFKAGCALSGNQVFLQPR
jgi:hypothetical protein